jgi:hypothetical protein
MKKILLLFFFSLIIASCEKDKQPVIVENIDIPLIDKILIGGEPYMEYSYNEANLVTEEKSKFHYTRHFYNERNQLIKSDFYWDISMTSSDSHVIEAAMNRTEWVNPGNTPKSISHTLEYNNKGELVRKNYIRTADNNSDYVEFTYEGDKIIKATGYYNNSISGYTNYIYDNNGNITRQMKYIVSSSGIAELATTTDYEYDNMPNPFHAFRRLTTPGVFTNPNNITKETYTLNFEVDPSIEKVQVTGYSYEYSDKGYPSKVNGLTEYIYK